MSIQPGSSKLAGRHSVPEIQKKQKSQIKKILLQLLNYQGALSVGYHRQYSFYRRRLFTAYAVTEDFFVSCLEDLYGFASANEEEMNVIRQLYVEKWKAFVNNSKYIMAAVAISLKSTGQHLAKNIEKNKIIKIESDTVWSEKIAGKDFSDYVDEKLEIHESSRTEMDLLMKRFDAEKEFYSIRGKWAITFFVKLLEYVMNNSRRYVSSLYTGTIKEPKRLCEITPDKAMVILAPRMKIAKTLQEFCNVHIWQYLKISVDNDI